MGPGRNYELMFRWHTNSAYSRVHRNAAMLPRFLGDNCDVTNCAHNYARVHVSFKVTQRKFHSLHFLKL